jgi:hypothetical protein
MQKLVSLAGHVSAAISNAFMNMVSIYLRIPNYMHAAYQYLVPLSVTQVDCERRFLTLKFILRSNIGHAGKVRGTYADVHA